MLIRHEGVRFKPYRDTVGKLTIGVGHNLDDKPLSQSAIEQILSDDISDVQQGLRSVFTWFQQIDSVRQDVLTDMAFNMGVGGLMGFRRFLAAMQNGDWLEAKKEMLDSKWAKQVGARAKELAAMVESGKYQGEGNV